MVDRWGRCFPVLRCVPYGLKKKDAFLYRKASFSLCLAVPISILCP